MNRHPTPNEIALVLKEACRMEGEDYNAVRAGTGQFRARTYAFIALCNRYRELKHLEVMRLLGVPEAKARTYSNSAAERARGGRGPTWFNLKRLNELVANIGWPPISREEACVRKASSHAITIKTVRGVREPVETAVEDYAPRISLAPVRLDTRVSDAPPTAAEIAAIESMYAVSTEGN